MRRRAAKIRKIFPDAKYKEVIVSRFVNRLMNDGKKSVVEKAIYEAFDDLEKKLKRSSIEIFKEALEVITPKIEVRSRRIGGATYQIPVEVSARRGGDHETEIFSLYSLTYYLSKNNRIFLAIWDFSTYPIYFFIY